MITEDDLSAVLAGYADDAPVRCTFDVDGIAPRGASSARRRLLAVGAAAALAAAACVATLLPAARPVHTTTSGAGPDRPVGPVLPTFTTSIPPATFLPTPAQRRALTRIGVEDGRINGDAHPQVSVVGTTLDRVWNGDANWLGAQTLSASARSYHVGSVRARVWVVLSRGHFEGGNQAMIDVVDAVTMRHGTGTNDVDNGDGVDPDTVLRPLGVVVRLR